MQCLSDKPYRTVDLFRRHLSRRKIPSSTNAIRALVSSFIVCHVGLEYELIIV